MLKSCRMLVRLCVSVLVVCGSAMTRAGSPEYVVEYEELLSKVEDRAGLLAIKALHQQLDDDNDGTIEPSETGDFIKADLKSVIEEDGAPGFLASNDNNHALVQFDGDGRREKLFHKKDSEITVSDLWITWVNSEVYNWTVEQTVDWLSNNIDLPQYAPVFISNKVDGTKLPLAAGDPSYLSKKLGISNSIHRSKISLKAMDVVLFGPPKEPTNWLKDLILSGLLLALISALFWAYNQKKKSEEHLAKMIKDMDSLNKAEKMLQDMQSKINKNEMSYTPVDQLGGGEEEVGRLREEVEILRNELMKAEVELEDKCWVAPTILQHWLQLTYEIESQVYNDKRKVAESQMALAKDACEKLKRKRSSLVGAFVSTHGRSIDDVDKTILEAKTALVELTQDLTERSRRWRQIEILTGVSIVSNPGLLTLQKIVRYVGGGNKPARIGMSSRMSNVSLDDMHDDDARSIAASSHMSSHLSVNRSLTCKDSALRRAAFEISRESSKESSNSESDDHIEKPKEILRSRISQSSMSSDTSRLSQRSEPSRSATPPLSLSPTQRRLRMVKSFSQDASHEGTVPTEMTGSVSEGALHTTLLHRVKGSKPVLDEIEESCSASDTGSLSDLTLEGKKKEKKSFFNFRRKKEKVETLS